MSDFLDMLVAPDAPEAREVTVDGQTGTVYFRRISAGEREQLLKGLKVVHTPGGGSTVDIDLAENERQSQMLVLFSVCREDGSRFFTNVDQVKKLPHHKLAVLARHASEVNRESDDLGKD